MAVPYGKYLLERKLTEGGMAEIFIARPNPALAPPDLAARRGPIVIKRLFAHHSSEGEFVRMFFNEARLAARVKHPNIVDIFDQGESDGTYFLAMEYIPGEDLRALVQQSDAVNRRPELAMICRIIMDTLSGLHYAHTLLDERGQPLGLVHRDVSPQNVLVTYDGVVKLIDFGIAKATRARDSEQTQAGMIKGKYAYMSPEQTRGEQLDARSDVFSAGTLLWELLTWRRLFKRATDLATLVAVTEEPAPSTQAVNPEIPKELDDITMRALTSNREDRWNSAKEFHDALLGFVRRAGWDASPDTLGRYMKEIFADKLAAQSREAAAVSAEERPSRVPAQRPQAGTVDRGPGRQRAMTMPLQIINPALARKAMVMPKAGAPDMSGRNAAPTRSAAPPPTPPPTPSSRSSNQGRGGQGIPSEMVGADSIPMRIVPDSSTSLRQPASIPPLSGPPQLAAPQSLLALSGSPPETGSEGDTIRETLRSANGALVEAKVSAPTLARAAQAPAGNRRVILAVFIGVLFGVLAVFFLQYLVGSRLHRESPKPAAAKAR